MVLWTHETSSCRARLPSVCPLQMTLRGTPTSTPLAHYPPLRALLSTPRDLRIPQAMFQAAPRGVVLPIAHRMRPPMHDPPTTERVLGGHAPSLRCLVGDPGGLRTCPSSLLEPKYLTSESSSRPLISTGSEKAIIAKASKASMTGAPHYRKSCAKPKIRFS